MSTIEDKISKIKYISNIYADSIEVYMGTESVMKGKLLKLIEKHSENYELTSKNSIRSINYFSVVSRVKEVNSFSEKLVRHNEINKFLEIFSDTKKFPNKDLSIREKFKEVEDIIGIKILTDLNVDTSNMFNLIKSPEFQNDAVANEFEFSEFDIARQPTDMQNGLPIYKIRGSFRGEKFELQIKSKLESAWGDMEHAIFYKDYRLTPVRDLAQASMNHVGKLLLKIDFFLNDIRKANENFEGNSEIILFMNDFEKKYETHVQGNLDGISFNFNKISKIAFLANKSGVEFKPENYDLKYQIIESEKYSNYIKLRQSNFDLQILEACVTTSMEKNIVQENIDNILDDFFKIIMEAHYYFNLKKGNVQDPESLQQLVEMITQTCLEYNCYNFILETHKVEEIIETLIIVKDALDGEDIDENFQDSILQSFIILNFHGHIDSFLASISDAEKFKFYIEHVKNNISKDSNQYPKLIRFINILIKKLD